MKGEKSRGLSAALGERGLRWLGPKLTMISLQCKELSELASAGLIKYYELRRMFYFGLVLEGLKFTSPSKFYRMSEFGGCFDQ